MREKARERQREVKPEELADQCHKEPVRISQKVCRRGGATLSARSGLWCIKSKPTSLKNSQITLFLCSKFSMNAVTQAPTPPFCFKQIRHEVIFSQKQLNRNSLHVALRSWAERGEMITERQPQTLCVSSKQSAVWEIQPLSKQHTSPCVFVLAEPVLHKQQAHSNYGQVFTVEIDFCFPNRSILTSDIFVFVRAGSRK